ncbi:hypothetical protein [Bartonella quintana]|uniref:hypothetical protein n=1 Tax=Bartonella quintana TaxID=803 RepID=UPI00055698D7|nr:hypothetical protein [Bartonella quintana]
MFVDGEENTQVVGEMIEVMFRCMNRRDEETKCIPVLSSHPNWKIAHNDGEHFYKECYFVEASFNKCDRFKRIASLIKTSPFMGLLISASIVLCSQKVRGKKLGIDIHICFHFFPNL